MKQENILRTVVIFRHFWTNQIVRRFANESDKKHLDSENFYWNHWILFFISWFLISCKEYQLDDFKRYLSDVHARPAQKGPKLIIPDRPLVFRYPESEFSSPFQFKSIHAAPLTSEFPRLESETFMQAKQGLDQLVSLNYEQIDLRSILKNLAEYHHINMVMSDLVSGKINLHLNQVPLNQALDAILTTQGLVKRQMGSILLIDTMTHLMDQDNDLIKARQLEPIHAALIPIKYAKARDIAKAIKDKSSSLLSNQGSIYVDSRTNMILLHEKDSYQKPIKALVSRLDVPIQQVMIEARIVNLSKHVAQDLGARFGMTRDPDISSDSKHSASRFSDASVEKTSIRDGLNFDLPAIPLEGTPASASLVLAKLGHHVLLDLELSALESEGRAKIVASPRLLTTNLETALIESGEDIPYQETTRSGATSVAFRKAVLSLKVTPEITPQRKLLMDLKINQDTDSGRRVQGVPILVTKSIQTNVLVNDGQTIVLGGIHKQDKNHQTSGLPFLSKIAVLGKLLSRNEDRVINEELLIFITPRIITQVH